MIAMPCPPPIHAAARPYLFFLRFNSYNSVMTSRVPVAPSGWPSAMAPPFTLTLIAIQFQRFLDRQILCGERLVYFDEIDLR